MKKMCGGLFSFCFLHETVFGNGQVAITHNAYGLAKWGNYTHKSSIVVIKLNKSTNDK
jgi:hypothetical protein